MSGLSKEDVALYDRQIRLWGVAAQRNTVIITGFFTGVAQELVKNLTLKGVGRIILACYDADKLLEPNGTLFANGRDSITNEDLANLIMNQAASLNSAVAISFIKVSDASRFDVPPATSLFLVNEVDPQIAFLLNRACRSIQCTFEWILTGGFDAFLLNDFGPNYEYLEEIKKLDAEGQTMTEGHTKTMHFPDLESLWRTHYQLMEGYESPRRQSKARPADASPKFAAIQRALDIGNLEGCCLKQHMQEFAPVNSIIGGLAAQEAVKAISGRDMPLDNLVIFNGRTLDSTIVSVPSSLG